MTDTGERHGFGPDARLRRRPEFLRVYDNGRWTRGRFFRCVFCPTDVPEQPPRLGLTVPRRVGHSVVRNRLKRLTREFFRQRRAEMAAGFDVLVHPKSEATGGDTRALWDDLERIFQKAGALERRAGKRSCEQ